MCTIVLRFQRVALRFHIGIFNRSTIFYVAIVLFILFGTITIATQLVLMVISYWDFQLSSCSSIPIFLQYITIGYFHQTNGNDSGS